MKRDTFMNHFFLALLILICSRPTNTPLPLYGSGFLNSLIDAANKPSLCLSVHDRTILVADGTVALMCGGMGT